MRHGWPFVGQFIAHDITADRSPVGISADIETLRNARSPRLNLELLHGEGSVGAPYLYDTTDPTKLLVGPDGRDIPRNSQGTALIGDPRNDVHRMASQLHLALIRVHNGLIDQILADGVPEDDLFNEDHHAVTWHYQWMVIHQGFLPRLIGNSALIPFFVFFFFFVLLIWTLTVSNQ